MTANILIVDDDADLRQTLQQLLNDSGYRVTAAANGQAAIEHLLAGARPDPTRPPPTRKTPATLPGVGSARSAAGARPARHLAWT